MTIKEFIIMEVPYEKKSELGNIEEIVDVFLAVLNCKIVDDTLNGVGERVMSCLNSLSSAANNRDDLLKILTTINLTEIFARKVLFITNIDSYKDIVENKKGFFVVLRELGFSANKAEKISNRRNIEGDHECNELSLYEINLRINKFILDYLQITCMKISELTQYIKGTEKEEFFPLTYINSIINEYEREVADGFKYMDVHWFDEDNTSTDCNIDNLIMNKDIWGKDTFGVKFLGEAGTGKTTALRRMQYRLAKKYYEKEGTKIPIYIPLGDLNQDTPAITSRICEITQLDRERVYQLLRDGDIILLLDGYNEILNPDILRGISKEIDRILRIYYSKTQIYISDRTVSRNSIPVMTDAVKLFLKEIKLEDKLSFFKRRTSDGTFVMIKEHAKNHPEYFNHIETPYKMTQFVEIVNRKKMIPDDVTESYIKDLIARERDEKKRIRDEGY